VTTLTVNPWGTAPWRSNNAQPSAKIRQLILA
jgi:hypothetical protein